MVNRTYTIKITIEANLKLTQKLEANSKGNTNLFLTLGTVFTDSELGHVVQNSIYF